MSPTAHPHRRLPGAVLTLSLLLLSLQLASSSASTKVSATADADSVRAAESARARALLQADTTALSRLVADEFIEVSRLGTLRTKADNLGDIATGTLKLTSVKYDSMTVRVYGDVAVLRAIADNTGMMRGFPFAGKIWYTRVFVRRAGRWQAVAMQQTSIQ